MRFHSSGSLALILMFVITIGCSKKSDVIPTQCLLKSLQYGTPQITTFYYSGSKWIAGGDSASGSFGTRTYSVVYDQQQRVSNLQYTGSHVRVTYDQNSRIDSVIHWSDAPVMEAGSFRKWVNYKYNSTGQLISMIDNNLNLTTYQYPNTMTHNYSTSTVSGATVTTLTTSYTYDNKPNPLNLNNSISPENLTDNNVSKSFYGSGIIINSFQYNHSGFPTQVLSTDSNSAVPVEIHYTFINCN